MKILFLTRLYYPHIGGVEKHVHGICQVLKKRHQIKIITEKYDPSLTDHEVIDGVEVYRVSPGNKWHTWSELNKLKDLLNWADMIHAHDVYFWLFPYRLTHWFKKTFVTFHGWEGIYPIPLKTKLIRKLSELFARGNICIGDYIAKWYGTKPDVVSYGAI